MFSMAQAETSNLAANAESILIEAQRVVLAEEKKKVFDQFSNHARIEFANRLFVFLPIPSKPR